MVPSPIGVLFVKKEVSDTYYDCRIYFVWQTIKTEKQGALTQHRKEEFRY